MFRELQTLHSATPGEPPTVQPPESFSLFPALRDIGASTRDLRSLMPVKSSLHWDSVFTVAVDPGLARKTVANWRVGSPEDIIDLIARFDGQ
jgi:hypothetical protein